MRDDHLQALVAVVDEGTFEAAGRRLHITQSAISQRIRALEQAVGSVVVGRAAPCRPTQAGQVLVQLGRRRAELDREALARLGLGGEHVPELRVAVNADSLATWFVPVLSDVAVWSEPTIRLRVADQERTAELLRAGDVAAAVTASSAAVQGCSVRALGTMRYLPVAAASLAATLRDGSSVWTSLPSLRYDADDDLQAGVLRRHRVAAPARVHHIASSDAFAAAVYAGLGWGMLPTAQADSGLKSGELVLLSAADAVQVPLYWQCWRTPSAALSRLTEAVVARATAQLPARA